MFANQQIGIPAMQISRRLKGHVVSACAWCDIHSSQFLSCSTVSQWNSISMLSCRRCRLQWNGTDAERLQWRPKHHWYRWTVTYTAIVARGTVQRLCFCVSKQCSTCCAYADSILGEHQPSGEVDTAVAAECDPDDLICTSMCDGHVGLVFTVWHDVFSRNLMFMWSISFQFQATFGLDCLQQIVIVDKKKCIVEKNKTYLRQLWSPTPSLAANGVHCFETPPSGIPSVSAASHPVQPLCDFYVHSSFSSSWSQMQSCKNIGLVLGASHTISPTKQYTCHPQPSAVKFNASLSRSVRFAIFAMLANHVATQIRVTKLLFYFTDARTGLWSCKLCTYCKPHGIRQYCGHNFAGWQFARHSL